MTDISVQDDDDDTCEEWERHEALHDDVTRQERNDERLFESEMEVTWDKGSSGLVFYTDAAYWKELEGGKCEGKLWCKAIFTTRILKGRCSGV